MKLFYGLSTIEFNFSFFFVWLIRHILREKKTNENRLEIARIKLNYLSCSNIKTNIELNADETVNEQNLFKRDWRIKTTKNLHSG